MKRVITAILPLILAAQLPFGTMKYFASEWMKKLDYGLKWTELMMTGFPGTSESDESQKNIPEGKVTMTVTLASAIPEIEIESMPLIEIDQEFCRVEMEREFQRNMARMLKQHRELKEHRLIKVGTVNLIQL